MGYQRRLYSPYPFLDSKPLGKRIFIMAIHYLIVLAFWGETQHYIIAIQHHFQIASQIIILISSVQSLASFKQKLSYRMKIVS